MIAKSCRGMDKRQLLSTLFTMCLMCSGKLVFAEARRQGLRSRVWTLGPINGSDPVDRDQPPTKGKSAPTGQARTVREREAKKRSPGIMADCESVGQLSDWFFPLLTVREAREIFPPDQPNGRAGKFLKGISDEKLGSSLSVFGTDGARRISASNHRHRHLVCAWPDG